MKIIFYYIIFDDAKLQSIVTAILRQCATICDNVRQFWKEVSSLNIPKSEIHIPKSEIHIPQSEIHIPKSEIHIPQSEIHIPQSAIHNPQSFGSMGKVLERLPNCPQ